MKVLFALLVAVAAAACGDKETAPPKQITIVDRIASTAVAEGLPLGKRSDTRSGDGRKKSVWPINDLDFGKLEVIGNDQQDADLIAWNCVTFVASGEILPALPSSHFCHRLFVQVLGKFISTPDVIAKALLSEAARSRATAAHIVGDFSIETDGEFFFVRRWSRMKLH